MWLRFAADEERPSVADDKQPADMAGSLSQAKWWVGAMVTLRQIAEAETTREDFEEAYLRERGWRQTCETPGSLWVWTKTLPDGRVVLVGRTQAIAFAAAFEREEEKLAEWVDWLRSRRRTAWPRAAELYISTFAHSSG
jgi:hypothetical protein